jgi:hypothetical protein
MSATAPGVAAPQRPGPLRVALRAVLRSTQGRFLLAVLVVWLAYEAWLSLAAPGKIADGIPADRERVNLLVTLPFAPERFHVLAFQRFGRVSGTEGNTIEVRSVPRTQLTRLARPYWVRRVEPLKP